VAVADLVGRFDVFIARSSRKRSSLESNFGIDIELWMAMANFPSAFVIGFSDSPV
jgi:hypothetical protein